MEFFRIHAKSVCRIVTVCLLALSAYIPSANAGIIGTEVLLNAEQNRAKVETFFTRADIQQQLITMGVDPAHALTRADRLTDSEIQAMADRIDQMPAGADAAGAILFIFLVLLVTDLLGLTDVFPFVNK